MGQQPMIVGRPALVVIDIQKDGGLPVEVGGIPRMPGFDRVVATTERLVAAAHVAGVPVIYFQEAHRRSGVDFGRELDGVEGRHCVEGDEGTALWPTLLPGPDDHFITKRRYSCFFGTELSILLNGLGANTLVLTGGLTDVCVHYTFADAHQHRLLDPGGRGRRARLVRGAARGGARCHGVPAVRRTALFRGDHVGLRRSGVRSCSPVR